MAVLGASDAKVMDKTKTSDVLPPVLMIIYRSQDLEVLRASMVNQFRLLVRMARRLVRHRLQGINDSVRQSDTIQPTLEFFPLEFSAARSGHLHITFHCFQCHDASVLLLGIHSSYNINIHWRVGFIAWRNH